MDAHRESPASVQTAQQPVELQVRPLLVAQVEQELSEQKGVHVTGAHLHLSGYCAQCQN